MVNAILFDLDGTLMPVSQDDFTKAYFKALTSKASSLGYEKDAFVKAIWAGTSAMQNNDGSAHNDVRFWEVFSGMMGTSNDLRPMFDSFYANEFDSVKSILPRPIDHSSMINMLREKGYFLVLATNPFFPMTAIRTRLSWFGLSAEDFLYITHYENSCYCKPSMGYYKEIFHNIGRSPEECLMIGNNADEDACVAELGAEVYLVTDVPEGHGSAGSYSHGSFAELKAYLESLPVLR